MNNPIKKNFLTVAVLVIAALLFFMVNIASGVFFKSWRLDLTENKIYTLSTGSKEIINQLPEPVILRFYFSKKVAKLNPYLVGFASRVQDLLVQYERSSKGKIILEVIDPEPFSVAEDQAVNYGLRGLPIDNSGTELYLGLVGTNSVNVKKVIPFFQVNREENLEYDISQLINKLAHPEVKVLGVMSALPLQGKESAGAWAVWQQMAQSFDLKSLEVSAQEIPAEIETLMIVEPKHFSSEALKAIDKFIMRGGHLLAFIDPYSEVSGQKAGTVNFNELLKAWGVELQENKVVADRSIAKSVMIRQQDGRESSVTYPLWIDFTANNFDKQDVLTSSLEKITLATPGSLVPVPGAATKFSPLITTTKDAMLLDASKIHEYQQNFNNFMTNYKASGAYVVAARLSGPINSAYSDNKIADSNILIVADADMLHDHFWVKVKNVMGRGYGVPNASNGNFVLSALDNLSGSNALISIRNRGTFVRPFETIRSLEAESKTKYRATEQDLQQKLVATKSKLEQLEKQKKEGNSMQLNAQQRKEEDAFRSELVETRRELREVRRKLNKDIEAVETSVKFFSIGFIPLLIVFGCLIAWGLQIQRELRLSGRTA